MQILVMALLYAPDGGPSAPLYQMLCEQLTQLGHEVTMIAAVPHYPSGTVPPAFRRGWITTTHENGVQVIRVRVPSVNRSRLGWRLLQFGVYQLGAAAAAWGCRFEVAIIGNPALEVFLPFLIHIFLRRKPALYSIHDVYPEVGVQLGVFRKRWIIGLVAMLERFCYRHSRLIRLSSPDFEKALSKVALPPQKLTLIYDWVDTDHIQPMPRRNAFSAEHGLDDSWVMLYAGNMGLSQGLETLLEAAALLQNEPGFRLVLVGEGTGRESLQARAAELNLSNVTFLPFQPRARLPEVLASGDALVVSLKPGVEMASIPSKTWSILAAGRPIVAIMDRGVLASLITKAGAGLQVPPGDPMALVKAARALRADPESAARQGARGRAYVETHHTPQGAARAFERCLLRIREDNR
ncbi:MAG: glycosyltransferase family 4 protein [Anaerolineae bacterium]|nr:glycosyltransferase family 4 protein [Anaerolineae bacterium]